MNGLTLILALVCGCGEQKEDTGFVDADGDGVLNSTDCDDADSTVHGPTTWYEDADGDGFGNPDVFIEACEAPDGFVVYDLDCDDEDEFVHFGAEEICDELDNDCDGNIDEDATSTFYADTDGDGYGDPLNAVQACMSTESTVSNADDCDDTNDQINPGMIEICNDGWDNDCDGTANACEYTDEFSLADAHAIFRGGEASVYAGLALAAIGDQDADGFGDLAIGAPDFEEKGAVFVVSGTRRGEVILSDAEAIALLAGESADDNAGISLANVGDVDGDGFDDLLIGADYSSAVESYAGAAYLVLGPVNSSRSLSVADMILYGVESDGFLGSVVASVGDMSGDGVVDLAVGAMGEADGTGAVYLFSGSERGEIDIDTYQAKLAGESLFDAAGGIVVTGAGDVDGDGVSDLIIGMSFNNGRRGAVYLVLGPVSGSMNLSEADGKLTGEDPSDHAGAALSSIDDVNGDGYGDFLVGANYNNAGGTYAGAAYLVLGPVSDSGGLSDVETKLTGEKDDLAGGSVAMLGDTNGDGESDCLIGAEGNGLAGRDAGVAYLVYGPVSGVVTLSEEAGTFTGEDEEDAAGNVVAPADDVDNDGYQDFLVGALSSDLSGAVYLVLGQGI